jgi:hypothetical protein
MASSTAARVGILTIAALIALGMITLWKTELFMVREGYEMIGSFESIEGLTVGSEVRYRGLKVGKVMKIDPGPFDIKSYSIISKTIKFPRDSYLRVAYDGIVGEKFLEIIPGTSESIYSPPQILPGRKTAAIVDFVDIGARNLEETKKILEDIRAIIEDPKLREAIYNTIYTAEQVAQEADRLTAELRQTNQGIREIVTDPKFQANFKGTIRETEKTLSSANKFFDTVSKINVRASAGIDVGSKDNAVMGDLDIIRDESDYFRFTVGEGPTRDLSLLDVLFNSKLNDKFGFRLGMINKQIGGGVAYYLSRENTIRGDIYDINNPRPNWPKLRLAYEHELESYLDFTLKGDDLLNEGNRNFTFGIRVKPPGSRIY